MNPASVERELRKHLAHLADDQQRLLLEFARALPHAKQRGVTGSSLLRFAGVMSAGDADEIRQAVEDGCERVNLDEW